jgi:hypothetical protein
MWEARVFINDSTVTIQKSEKKPKNGNPAELRRDRQTSHDKALTQEEVVAVCGVHAPRPYLFIVHTLTDRDRVWPQSFFTLTPAANHVSPTTMGRG